MKPKSVKQLQKDIDAFNKKYPVGSAVMVEVNGEVRHTKVISEATVLGGHSAVGWFDGISGCYDLDFVTEM